MLYVSSKVRQNTVALHASVSLLNKAVSLLALLPSGSLCPECSQSFPCLRHISILPESKFAYNFFPLPLNLLYHMMQNFTHLVFLLGATHSWVFGIAKWSWGICLILQFCKNNAVSLWNSMSSLEFCGYLRGFSHFTKAGDIDSDIYFYGCRETCGSFFSSCPFCLKCNLCCRVWTSFLQRGWGLSWADQSYRTSLQVWGQLYSSCKWKISCIFLSKTESEKCRIKSYQAKVLEQVTDAPHSFIGQ